jgi:hypothetical protein
MQPVTKGDIEGIRGVSVDSVLATLVDRRLLTEAGRKEVAGRPILYKTTPEFLEAFGLRSLEELPPIEVEADAPVELALAVVVPQDSEPVSAPESPAEVHAEVEAAENAGDESEAPLAP